jgi:hypothetical protein
LTKKISHYYLSCYILSRSIQGQYNCPTQFIFGGYVCTGKKKLFPHPSLKRDLPGGSNFFSWGKRREKRIEIGQTEMKWNWTHGRNWGEEQWRQDETWKGLEIKTKILFRRQNTSVCQARTHRNCFSLVTYYDNIYTYVCDCMSVDLNLRVYVRVIICVCVCMVPYYFPRDQSKSVN